MFDHLLGGDGVSVAVLLLNVTMFPDPLGLIRSSSPAFASKAS